MKGSLIWTLVSCFFNCKVIRKIKNNPIWQICFQKGSLSFSIITEKYSLIVLTPVERFDRGLMYYPVVSLIQRPPPFVLGRIHRRQILLRECYFSSYWCLQTEGDEKPNVPSNRQWKATVQMQIFSALEEGTIYQFDSELQVVVVLAKVQTE